MNASAHVLSQIVASPQTPNPDPDMPEQTNYWLVYLLFMIAGLLVGAGYSAYKAEKKGLTIGLGVLAVIALAGAVLWMIGELGG